MNNGHHTNLSEVFNRVNLVEREVGNVRSEVSAIVARLDSQSTTLQRIVESLEEKSSTDWKALAAWGALIVAVGGAIFTLTVAPLKERLAGQEQFLNKSLEQRASDMQQMVHDAEERGAERERMNELRAQIEMLWQFHRNTDTKK